jgi:hypothetical protein
LIRGTTITIDLTKDTTDFLEITIDDYAEFQNSLSNDGKQQVSVKHFALRNRGTVK